MASGDEMDISKQINRVSAPLITVYSRHGCHLCEVAIELLESMRTKLEFTIQKIYIDGDPELEKLFGEQIPVIHINGEHHDYWRVDPDRFKSSLEKHRQRQ